MEGYVAGYRADPKMWVLVEGLAFDDSGRLWVGTKHDHDAGRAGGAKPDGNGVAQRAIDWCDISRVEIGRDE